MYVADSKRLTSEGAKQLMAAALGMAEQAGVAVTVAIADAGGHLLMLERMEGGRFHTVHSATTTAVCAASNRRVTGPRGAQRDAALPDVPTAREQGADVALEAWRGIAVPRGTPAPVIAALGAAIRRTVEAPEFASASENLGVRPAFMAAAEFGELIAKEDAVLARVMQQIGLKR